MTDDEFDAIMKDEKVIQGNITWKEDEDHSPAMEFRIDVQSKRGLPLFVHGRYNADAETLNFALVSWTTGRIYGLDLGRDHHNPECTRVGEKHKHRWSEQYRDKEAYVPKDIAADASDPVAVWQEFCVEACIRHDGDMARPYIQKELRLWT